MGGNQSHNFDEKLFNSQWQRKQGNYGGRNVWRNRSQPQNQIQEYPIFANTQHDIERQNQLFNLRKSSDQLVSATHLKSTVKEGLCSSAAQGRLFLERIPLKLQALQHIPFPDILNLHFNALSGYKKLAKVVGPFRPQQQQIGFNIKGQTKIWLNGDFSASQPVSKQTSEASMVRNILQIVEDNTDNNTTPRQNPSILNYIYRNQSQINFDQALISVREFVNQYNNGIIPKRLQCIQKVGIQTISRSLVQLKQQRSTNLNNQSQRNSINHAPIQHHSVNLNSPSFIKNTNFSQNRVFTTNTITPPVYSNVGNNLAFNTRNSNIGEYRAPQIQKSNINFNFGGSRVQNFTPPHPVSVIPSVVQQQPVTIQKQPGFVQPTLIPRIVNNPVSVPQTYIQSQVQTVRPVQQLVDIRPPQQQKVFQQIIRQPVIQQAPVLIQQPILVNHLNQGSIVNIENQVPLIQQNQIQFREIPNKVFISQKVQINNQSQNQNTETQQVVQINTLSHQSSSNQLYGQSQSRNVIQSNTTVIQNTKAPFLVQKIWEGNNNFETKEYNTFSNNNGGLQFNSASSRYKQVNLQDGKSSEALLAQLRGLSSNTGYKFDTNANSNSYKYQSSNSYNFDTYKPTNNYNIEQNQRYIQTTNNVNSYDDSNYNMFTKYAKGGDNLEDNLQMKYSMTQQLYDHHHQPQKYQYQSHTTEQYEYPNEQYQYQQEGEYHVDYDPQILADIQRMNK